MRLSPSSNIENKVRNTKLPKTKPLMPLFEVLSNSIHAINDAKRSGQLSDQGSIVVELIRQGKEDTLVNMENIDEYPIVSFDVRDNGIGLNNENLYSFAETDTDHKIDIGGKGVGRFVCLRAFDKLSIFSKYIEDGKTKVREFDFQATKDGFSDIKEYEIEDAAIGTRVRLVNFKKEYQKRAPRPLREIGRAVILHFQLYFLNNAAPAIEIRNQNGDYIKLQSLFQTEFQSEIRSSEFVVKNENLRLVLSKSSSAQSHKIHFCAHYRSVKEEGLANRIVDLGKYSIKDSESSFYYNAFVEGNILDENVDLERTGFSFPSEEDDETVEEEITLANIRNGALQQIEVLLHDYLENIRLQKIEKYRPIVEAKLPQYRSVLNHRIQEVKQLPPNLNDEKLDIELYKIENSWKAEVKERQASVIDDSKDITNLSEYKEKYEKFLSDFNEIGKSDLARYVVHRKAVIDLLENLLHLNEDEKFTNEDIIHSIFFPIRSSSDEIPFDKQNLWLLDERLTYHTFLSSDKSFEKIENLEVDSKDRSDLLIYNDAIIFTEDSVPPYNSFTMVEFKKPQRNDYRDYDDSSNPIEQTEKYVELLQEGRVKDRNGRFIQIDPQTPFFIYIVCDITPTLIDILKRREFNKTPDGQGFFKFKNLYSNAYFEVLPFEKVLTDSKKRNRILFDKLGIQN